MTVTDLNGNKVVARAAGLRYVNDDEPGISRRRAGKGFSYRSAGGAVIRDRDELRRIGALAVPPAWTDVWICSSARGHIQATGRDARGRKQYRYHPEWTRTRDEAKYERTVAFARALPRLRRRVARDLARRGLPRVKVIAAVIRLLEVTLVRVGNEEYARHNRSFGLTTLRRRHAEVHGSAVKFTFRGKSGVMHTVGIRDRRLARVVRQCQELPGQHLFEYVDDDGAIQTVNSEDVNDYMRDAMGSDFTAKDFRTWAGTVLALRALRTAPGELPTKKALKSVVDRVADELGNTPTVARSGYIHPALIDAYLDGSLNEAVERAAADASTDARLRADERLVLSVLER